MTQIKPFGNNILVKPVEKKQVLVADRASLCEYGEVVAIGEDVGKRQDLFGRSFGLKSKEAIKVGDTIGYLVWGINSLEINDEKYYFVPETSEFILGTIELARE